MLSDIDLKLISELENDGRASYLELSRKLGVSFPTVAKRVRHLLRSGTIKITAVPNRDNLNLSVYAFVGMNVSMDSIDEVCAAFQSHFNANLVATTFGRFNLLIGMFFQNREKLDQFITSNYLRRNDIYEMQILYAKELKKPLIRSNPYTHPKQRKDDIDELDQKIINYLVEDGRRTCVYLESKLSIRKSSISKRIDRLLKKGFIEIKAQIDSVKVGYNVNAFIFLRVDHSRLNEIITNLCAIDEVISILTLMNSYDIYVGAIAKDLDSLYEFIKRTMTDKAGIFNIETVIAGKVMKRYYSSSHLKIMLQGKEIHVASQII